MKTLFLLLNLSLLSAGTFSQPTIQNPLQQTPLAKNGGDNPAVVNVIQIGTSVNGAGYGYSGGQRTMVWADDNLKAVINVHRMGPGTTPPSLSGYLAADVGTNYGATSGDWKKNHQIYASTLNSGATYFLDAARFPQGGIYNPPGNTSLANAYIHYFAPNLSNDVATWGGLSYGVVNMVNQADSNKHLYWYDPPPYYTYIPDGFAISSQGVSLAADINQKWSGNTLVGYRGSIIVNRGVWNTETHDFDYTRMEVPFPTTNNARPLCCRVAFSPDGNHAWIVVIGNNGINLDSNYYPIIAKSVDAGKTWGPPMNVTLDGPDGTGIPGITHHLLSDYRIKKCFPAGKTRDEIPYTTGYDCSMSVDKWGNPHIGVVVGVCGGGYRITTGPSPTWDSTWAVYDLYTQDHGMTFSGQIMGYPKTFRGAFTLSGSTVYEDNRTCIASNKAGDKMFVTWNDTQIPGITDNRYCDVFARGFDLIQNKITQNHSGNCNSDNVTFISDITQQATFQCTSPFVFSNYPSTGKWTIPIVTEYLTVPGDLSEPVDFKYISDFSYSQDDFTCPVFKENPIFPIGIDEEEHSMNVDLAIFPNPSNGMITATVILPHSTSLMLTVTNLMGQHLLTMDKINGDAGNNQFTIDCRNLKPGVYFLTLNVTGTAVTRKLVIQ